MNFNFEQIFLLVHLTLCIWSTTGAQCIHPPYAEANKTALYRKLFNDYYLGRWSYNVIPEYRRNAQHNIERREERDKGGRFRALKPFQSRIYGKPSCKRNSILSRHSAIDESSTCPWFVVIDVDFNREPQSMAKAKCSCKRCLASGTGEQRVGRCATVNSYVPVIKWNCPESYSNTGGYYHYYIHMEEVPVGCTCRRPVNS